MRDPFAMDSEPPHWEALEPRLLLDGAGPRVEALWPAGAASEPDHIDLTFSGQIDAGSFTPDDVRVTAFPSVPRATVALPADGRDLCVDGHYAYLATRYDGLRIIDLSAPGGPREVASLPIAEARAVQVVDGLAYVLTQTADLHVIDVSDPTAPEEIGSADFDGSGMDLEISGSLAYVAASTAGLRIIDVSDPAAPVEVVTFPIIPPTQHSWSVEVVGSLAYVASNNDYLGTDECLVAVDVSDPSSPAVLAQRDFPGTKIHSFEAPGSLGYVGTIEADLFLLDLGPDTPLRVVWQAYVPVPMNDLAIADDLAFVAGDSKGMAVVDVSDAASAQALWSWDFGADPTEIAVDAGCVYLYDGDDGTLQVLDRRAEVGGIQQTGPRSFRLDLGQPLPAGRYHLEVGPDIRGSTGEPMDQDADGEPGDGLKSVFWVGVTEPADLLTPSPLGSPETGVLSAEVAAGLIEKDDRLDLYDMELPPGAVVCIQVTSQAEPDPTYPIRPEVWLFDPNGVPIAGAADDESGGNVCVTATASQAAGLSRLVVTDAWWARERYDLKVFVNAVGETEAADAYGGQDIDGSFVPLGGDASRVAVVGTVSLGDDDWSHFSLEAGDVATVCLQMAAGAGRVDLYSWDGMQPVQVDVLSSVGIVDYDESRSRIMVRTSADAAKLSVGSILKDPAGAEDDYVLATVVQRVGGPGFVLDRKLAPGTRDLGLMEGGQMELLASEWNYIPQGAPGPVEPTDRTVLRGFVARAAGKYCVKVSLPRADPLGDPCPYVLVVLRNAELEAEPNDGLAAAAQDITATGAAIGSLAQGGLGRLFVYGADANGGRIFEIDPRAGSVTRSFPSPVAPGEGLGLATTPTSLLVAGGEAGVVYELDPYTGQVLGTMEHLYGGARGLAYQAATSGSDDLAYFSWDSTLPPYSIPLSEVYIEVFTGAAGDYSKHVWDVPMDEGYASEWIWRLSQEQFDEFVNTPGHGQSYNYTGYEPGADPSTYWFLFEDQGWKGGGDKDYYDLMIRVQKAPTATRLTIAPGQSGYNFNLAMGSGANKEILLPDLKQHPGEVVVLPTYTPPGSAVRDLLKELYILQRNPDGTMVVSFLSDILAGRAVRDPQIVLDPRRSEHRDEHCFCWIPELAENQHLIAVDDDAAILVTIGEEITIASLDPGHSYVGGQDHPGGDETCASCHWLMRGDGVPGLSDPWPVGDEIVLHLTGADYRSTIDPRSPARIVPPGPPLVGGIYCGRPHMVTLPIDAPVAHALAATDRAVWLVHEGWLYRAAGAEAERLAYLPEVPDATGAGIIGHELFVSHGDRIEVYDLHTFAHLRTLRDPRLSSIQAVGADEPEPGDYYAVQAAAGDLLEIATTTPFGSELDPILELYGPDGKLLQSDDNSAGDGVNALIVHRAKQDGTYTVRIRPGDADGDGVVNEVDYVTVKGNLGRSPAGWADGDFDADGDADSADAAILKQHFGQWAYRGEMDVLAATAPVDGSPVAAVDESAAEHPARRSAATLDALAVPDLRPLGLGEPLGIAPDRLRPR